MWFSNSISRYSYMRNKNICIYKDLFITALFIVAKIWKYIKCLSSSEWININRILMINKKERTTHKWNNMNESQKHYSKWKMQDINCYMQFDSMYMTFWKNQNYRDRLPRAGQQERRLTIKVEKGKKGVKEKSCILIAVMVSLLINFVKLIKM